MKRKITAVGTLHFYYGVLEELEEKLSDLARNSDTDVVFLEWDPSGYKLLLDLTEAVKQGMPERYSELERLKLYDPFSLGHGDRTLARRLAAKLGINAYAVDCRAGVWDSTTEGIGAIYLYTPIKELKDLIKGQEFVARDMASHYIAAHLKPLYTGKSPSYFPSVTSPSNLGSDAKTARNILDIMERNGYFEGLLIYGTAHLADTPEKNLRYYLEQYCPSCSIEVYLAIPEVTGDRISWKLVPEEEAKKILKNLVDYSSAATTTL